MSCLASGPMDVNRTTFQVTLNRPSPKWEWSRMPLRIQSLNKADPEMRGTPPQSLKGLRRSAAARLLNRNKLSGSTVRRTVDPESVPDAESQECGGSAL